MIISNTVASAAAAQGAGTVNAPADDTPTLGFGVVGNGQQWVATPGPNYAISALGTAVATATSSLLVDWRTASYFTCTAFTSGWTITFTDASSVFTPVLGQNIKIKITHASGSTPVWPLTGGSPQITWLVGSGGAAPTTTGKDCVVDLVCTGVGSSPTFDGWYVIQT
jgi:hypothetical protein